MTASPNKIEPDEDEIELVLDVAERAKPVKMKKPITIQATGTVGKQKVKVEAAPIAVTIRAAE